MQSEFSPSEIIEQDVNIKRILSEGETPENAHGEWVFENCPLHGRDNGSISTCKLCNEEGLVEIWLAT